MNFKKYWKSLSLEERSKFAEEIGCSLQMIRNRYLSPNPERRPVPRRATIARMIEVSNGVLTLDSLCEYFVKDAVRGLQEKLKDPVPGV